jgi:hypothetical protein
MAVDIGRVAYQAFYKKLYPNDAPNHPSDNWGSLMQWEQDAWRHAAVAVLQQIDKEREDLEKGLIG